MSLAAITWHQAGMRLLKPTPVNAASPLPPNHIPGSAHQSRSPSTDGLRATQRSACNHSSSIKFTGARPTVHLPRLRTTTEPSPSLANPQDLPSYPFPYAASPTNTHLSLPIHQHLPARRARRRPPRNAALSMQLYFCSKTFAGAHPCRSPAPACP